MNRRIVASAVGFAALLYTMPGQAQFGGVVFDPTQSAHATSQIINEGKSLTNQATQIAQGSEANMTLGQQLTTDLQLAATALKTYTTAMNTYNTMVNNLKYFSVKQLWRTAENALMNMPVQNTMGETSGLQETLNGQSTGTAATVWRIMNTAIAGTSSSFWSNEIVGDSRKLSQLAAIEANDAASTQCLGAVGAYNAGRQANRPAESALQSSQFDTSVSTNSELEQINLLNANSSQNYNEHQAQGSLQTCMAAQAVVANMNARNAAADDINTWAFVQQQRASGDAMPAGSSSTWTNYLP